jgi:hypothetical protein
MLPKVVWEMPELGTLTFMHHSYPIIVVLRQ